MRAAHGSYGQMMSAMLGAGQHTVTYDVTTGALPDRATACDAYVLTGFPAGVHDGLPWISGLTDFLRQAKRQAKLVGICFGHQVMFKAFGGEVAKSPSGWGIGLHHYEVQHRAPWMGDKAHI